MQQLLKVLPQYLVPQHAYTRFFGWLATRKCNFLKNWMIQTFIRRYKVDMSAAVIEDPQAYATFNAFFTRYLKPELRPITRHPEELACPVDGIVSQVGKIEDTSIFQAKGFHYSLKSLLGGSEDLTTLFQNGHFATFYLSPRDYHRIHMPCAGTLQETYYIPGKLFSVNQLTASVVPHLFSRNERLVCLFETKHGPMAMILVGAMIVGKIRTLWEKSPEEMKPTSISHKTYGNITLERGQEMGYFELGSTVILLFGENKLAWKEVLTANKAVKMGEAIATFSLVEESHDPTMKSRT